jgi:hypothetical protein
MHRFYNLPRNLPRSELVKKALEVECQCQCCRSVVARQAISNVSIEKGLLATRFKINGRQRTVGKSCIKMPRVRERERERSKFDDEKAANISITSHPPSINKNTNG